MFSLQLVRTWVDYNYATHRRVWESVMLLSDEQFIMRIPYSVGSVRNHMVHLANVDAGWLCGLREDRNPFPHRANPSSYNSRYAVRALCERVAADMLEFVSGLEEEQLAYVPPCLQMPVWQVLLHLMNHGTDHRAQLLRILHDFQLPTFDQDFLFYLEVPQ